MALPMNKFNEPDDVASESLSWKQDTQAHMVPLPDTMGQDVDEVHQYDAPYGGKASLRPGPVNATGEGRTGGKNNKM